MREDQTFEIGRAFDLLPHVVGSSWAVSWFRFNGIKKPSRTEYREKVCEYFEMLRPLVDSMSGSDSLGEIASYADSRMRREVENIVSGGNNEVEKRYDRYIDFG